MNSLIRKPESFTIEDRAFVFRRFGPKDVTKLAVIVKEILVYGGLELSWRFQDLTPEWIVENQESIASTILLFGVERGFDVVFDTLTDLLREVDAEGNKVQITKEQMDDPDYMPLYGIIEIIANLACHPDLHMFRTAVEKHLQLPFFKTLLARVGRQFEKVSWNQSPSTSTSSNTPTIS